MTILVRIFLKKNIGILIFFLLLTALANQLMHLWAQNAEINLIDEQYGWRPYNAAAITHDARGLNIVAETGYNTTLYNRAYLPIEISSGSNKPVFLDIEYRAISYSGEAVFFAEVRDNKTNEILWRSFLNDNDRKPTNKTFELPPTLLNKPTEFRFYIQTDSPGLHVLDIKKALLRSSSVNATETAIDNTDTSVSTVANETANATETAVDNTDTSVSTVANETANATETAIDNTDTIVSTVANETANATETAVDNTDTSVSTVANETANATETAIDNTDTSVSTVANETANATETASNQTRNSVLDTLKKIFGGIMGNK